MSKVQSVIVLGGVVVMYVVMIISFANHSNNFKVGLAKHLEQRGLK